VALALTRLAQHHGISQRDMLERLITAADERITRRFDPTSSAWEAYFNVTQ
jgi:hypothetical protein